MLHRGGSAPTRTFFDYFSEFLECFTSKTTGNEMCWYFFSKLSNRSSLLFEATSIAWQKIIFKSMTLKNN